MTRIIKVYSSPVYVRAVGSQYGEDWKPQSFSLERYADKAWIFRSFLGRRALADSNRRLPLKFRVLSIMFTFKRLSRALQGRTTLHFLPNREARSALVTVSSIETYVEG